MKKNYYLFFGLLFILFHTLSAQSYQKVQKLTASDGSIEAYLGTSISVFGDYAVIGAPNVKTNEDFFVGAAYVYEKTSAGWKQVQRLEASAEAVNEPSFGTSVSLDGDRMLVGAGSENLVNDKGSISFFDGAVYVFEKKADGWKEAAKLLPSNTITFAHFGTSVALSGNRAVIGAFSEHAVYFFEKTSSGWQQINKFVNYTDFYNGTFGLSVSLYGDYAVVGYPSSNSEGDFAGAAYIYERTSTGWREIQRLYASDPKVGAKFGSSVVMNDAYVVVGTNSSYSGEVYVFEKAGKGWVETDKLVPSNAKSNDNFGRTLHLSGNQIMVGAQGSASAYVFEKSATGWQEKTPITLSGVGFGRSVFISNGQYFVGATGDDEKAPDAGAVYVFEEKEVTPPSSQLSIARFALINAKTDQVVAAYAELQEGAVINLASTGLTGGDQYNQLNIDAITNPTVVGSVRLELSGNVSAHTTQSLAPYPIFSDDHGDYYGKSLPVGSYTLTATPYSEPNRSGVEGESNTIHFTVVDEASSDPGNTDPQVLSVQQVKLLDADNDQDVLSLTEGVEVDLSSVSLSNFNIRAVTTNDVKSTRFQLTGPVSHSSVESKLPFALYGDDNGDYRSGGALVAGSYTLTITPYSSYKASGTVGTVKTIHFSVVEGNGEPEPPVDNELAVDHFALINARTDQVIAGYENLQDGAVINLTNTGLTGGDQYSELNIDAITNPSVVGSVRLELSGTTSAHTTQNLAPYPIFSDDQGDYAGGSLPVGSYTLIAIPFSEPNRGGVEGTAKTIHFTVVDQGNDVGNPDPTPEALSVQQVKLLNADTDQEIGELTEGKVINTTELNLLNFNISAETTSDVKSTRFKLEGPVSHSSVESKLPFALFGDDNGDYRSGGALKTGSYILTITPYSSYKASGEVGTVTTIHFSVIEDSGDPVSSNMEFRQRQKLTASDGKAWAHFGSAASVSGEVAVIGANDDADDGYWAGAAYIFEKNMNGLWEEKQKIAAHDSKTMSNFGSAVSVAGNTMMVGARDDEYGENAGAAYIFESDGASWKEVDKLYASDATGALDFASTVSLSGAQAVFGSLKSKAYIFEKTSTGWKEVAKLQPPDGNSYVGFGKIVSISGNTIAVGAFGAYESSEKSGAVFIYNKTTSGWSLVKTLTAPQGTYTFGMALQIDGNQMIVGAGNAVYIYEKSTAGWQQTAKILTADESNANFYGYNGLSIAGKYAVVGDDSDPEKDYGAGVAYLFEKTTEGWVLKSRILASDGSYYDHFGSKVAVEHDHILISSQFNNEKGRESGAVYSFELSEMPAKLSIDRFALIDAGTDQTIPGFEDIKDGAVINLAKLGFSGEMLNIDAVTFPEKIGSVRLELSGAKSASTTQSLAPYPIFSDDHGDYDGKSLPVGNYTLTAIPYSEPNRGGVEGTAKTIHFSVVDEAPVLAIQRFDLINADNNEKLVNIRDGEEINLYYFSNPEFDIVTNNFNIQAVTSSAKVGSVELEVYYNGSLLIKTLDAISPYSFFGDTGGNFSKWQPKLGNYRIKATPYSGANKSGARGQALEISFKVVNEGIAVPRFSGTDKKNGSHSQVEDNIGSNKLEPLPFALYPNPTATTLHIDYAGEQEEALVLSVYNAGGQLLMQKTGHGFLKEVMDVGAYPDGMYIAVLSHGGQKSIQKFIIRK